MGKFLRRGVPSINEHRVVIITGASRGIGRALALEFARSGADLVLGARSTDDLQKAVSEAEAAGGRALGVECDVTREDSVERLIDSAVKTYHKLDILVNNAGLGLRGMVAGLHPKDLRYVMEVNVFGVLNCVRHAVPHMRERKRGLIINICSVAGQFSVPFLGGYAATKAALLAVTDALRLEVAPDGVKVMSVFPGSTETAFRSSAKGEPYPEKTRRLSRVPPELVAKKIVRAADRPPRDLFITWSDKALATFFRTFPRLGDRILYETFMRKKA